MLNDEKDISLSDKMKLFSNLMSFSKTKKT